MELRFSSCSKALRFDFKAFSEIHPTDQVNLRTGLLTNNRITMVFFVCHGYHTSMYPWFHSTAKMWQMGATFTFLLLNINILSYKLFIICWVLLPIAERLELYTLYLRRPTVHWLSFLGYRLYLRFPTKLSSILMVLPTSPIFFLLNHHHEVISNFATKTVPFNDCVVLQDIRLLFNGNQLAKPNPPTS